MHDWIASTSSIVGCQTPTFQRSKSMTLSMASKRDTVSETANGAGVARELIDQSAMIRASNLGARIAAG